MESNETSKTPVYNSTYLHGVDEKRRVAIPSRWRPAEPGIELTLVVWPQAKEGACLRVLLPEQLAQLMRKIEAMPASENKTSLRRRLGSKSVQVTLDKVGRVIVPESMAAETDIKEQALFVGLLDRYEIWSPDRYSKVQAADDVLAADAYQLLD
jgi:MraZ protein